MHIRASIYVYNKKGCSFIHALIKPAREYVGFEGKSYYFFCMWVIFLLVRFFTRPTILLYALVVVYSTVISTCTCKVKVKPASLKASPLRDLKHRKDQKIRDAITKMLGVC